MNPALISQIGQSLAVSSSIPVLSPSLLHDYHLCNATGDKLCVCRGIIINTILFFIMQSKKEHRQLIQKAMFLIYQYMDIWLPFALFTTLPIWIVPALLYLLTSRVVQLTRCFLRIGNNLIHHPPRDPPAYAILKGNGRYLRDEGENVHQKQFYDYTSRRFMSIGKFQTETKIIELECEGAVGLEFFMEAVRSGTVVGVQSNHQVYKNTPNALGLIVETEYKIQGDPVGYDCLMLFNFKSKMGSSNGKIDLLHILSYCRYHMDKSGYIVYGDYFQEGELQTFIDIFEGFQLKVAEQEDITKNMDYAKKLADRNKVSIERKAVEIINGKLNYLLGKKTEQEGKQFIVLILEKEAC